MAKKLDTLMKTAEKKANEYAKAYNEKDRKKSELKALKKAALAAVDQYNLELSKATYLAWNEEGDPVKTAIRLRIVPGAQKVQFKTDEDDYMVVNFKDAEYDVNLPQMQATLGAEVFSDKSWFNLTEKFAFIIANSVNEHCGDSVKFEYQILDASKAFDLPEGIDPLSDEGGIMMLQKVFDSILYIDNPDNPGTNLIHTAVKKDKEGRVFSTEWSTIREEMTARVGRNTVGIVNTGVFTHLIADAMWACMTQAPFLADSKKYDCPIKDKNTKKSK